MPERSRPATPTKYAGTSSRTHPPADGNGPIYRRLAVLSTPPGILPARHEHHLLRQITRIQEDLGEQNILVPDLQLARVSHFVEEVLVQACRDCGGMRSRPRRWRRVQTLQRSTSP